MTADAIMAEIEDIYRSNYKCACRGVSWSFPLKLLQLVAVCLGGSGLSAICKALSVNYRHFSAGAPDLLLIRISVADNGNGAGVEANTVCGNAVKKCIPLDVLLGPDWETLGSARDSDEPESEWNSLSKATGTKRSFSVHERNANEGQSSEISSHDDKNFEIVVDNVRPEPFHCDQESLDLSAFECLKFESMLVEVKGPTDHLAYKQRLWLELLAQAKHSMKAAICFVKER